MPKVSPIQNNFNSGEVSGFLDGRVDYKKYQNSLKVCLNQVPMIQGPLTRRPGTRFVNRVKYPSLATRVVLFEFSVEQAYVLEFGEFYFRVYRNNAPVMSGGVHVEVATPYAAADLAAMKFTQSADVLYVAHGSYAPRKITRTSHTAWTIATIDFLDGPYHPANTTATTLTPSGTTGSVTITASSPVGINKDAGFRAPSGSFQGDIGRLIRLGQGGWGVITAVGSNTSVTVTVRNAFPSTSAEAAWRLGVWCPADGYPVAVAFYEDRLCWGGAGGAPSRVDMSNTSKYELMSPTNADVGLTVLDTHAISAPLNARSVQVIRWLMADEKGLLAGTVKGEWVIRASEQGEAITPTNRRAIKMTNYGSADIAPEQIGKDTLFVSRARRKVRALNYVFADDGFRSSDVTVLSNHLTKAGITGLTYQQEPQSVLWATSGDGVLLGIGFEREQEVLGWHPHKLGGYSNVGKTVHALVESIVSAPSADLGRDEVWMVVKRVINGNEVRYIEYMTKFWEEGDDPARAVMVDCSLEYDGVPTNQISSAQHLAGEVVSVLGDGADLGDFTVSGLGTIDLPHEVSVAQVGLPYNSDGKRLRWEAGAADGTAQGKTQRTHKVGFRLLDTGGMSIGPSFDKLKPITFRRASHPMDEPVPLFTGDKIETWPGDYSRENVECWRFNRPLPGNLLAVMPQLHTQDA